MSSGIREYAVLNNGCRMPMVGFGTWDVRGQEGLRCISSAIEEGYRLFDTARMYGNEDIVSKAIQDSGIDRDEFFVTTKLNRPCEGNAIKCPEESLSTFDGRIDLLLIHGPYATSDEMYGAMESAYRDGKVGAIGVSNFHAEFYSSFVERCGIVPAVD